MIPIPGPDEVFTAEAEAVEQWLKEEAIKREKEVQESQKRFEAAREVFRARQAEIAANGEPKLRTLLQQDNAPTATCDIIEQVCDEFKVWLLKKNKQYGDSAIKPVRVFSDASDEEQLLVRLDDKLSRLIRGNDDMEPDEDIMWDLCGYWILLQVVRRKADRADT